ncbi:hypothetical protein MUK42_04710 [Musa troglodytarum]|uniref:Uncharacterized protein n=1 Tax=Musa troglodytarum TaxID=320322 RepID=A0A9E7KJN2_9LILI|nr:hypothetical protein MUK42_04710 [Musa troglodytarum]
MESLSASESIATSKSSRPNLIERSSTCFCQSLSMQRMDGLQTEMKQYGGPSFLLHYGDLEVKRFGKDHERFDTWNDLVAMSVILRGGGIRRISWSGGGDADADARRSDRLREPDRGLVVVGDAEGAVRGLELLGLGLGLGLGLLRVVGRRIGHGSSALPLSGAHRLPRQRLLVSPKWEEHHPCDPTFMRSRHCIYFM